MAIKVFIDGAEGTTGLRLADRLNARQDVELLAIDSALRKDADERAQLSNAADIVFFCLPDAAAKESVARITNPSTRIIDASTAHRVDEGWVYGFPELSDEQREKIAAAKRITNPGCHATGFISLVAPLIRGGIAAADYPFTCHSVTGYSGAGKSMIAKYVDKNRPDCYNSPRQYALGQRHKHLPEMQKHAGIAFPPIFNPIIADFYAGMVVTAPLHVRLLEKRWGAKAIHAYFTEYYAGQSFIRIMPLDAQDIYEGAMVDAGALAGLDRLEIFVCGHEDQVVLLARFDNLGKGASGAAIQCMNILCGLEETTGLSLQQNGKD